MEDERMYEYRDATPWYREEPDPRETYPQDDRYGDPDDYEDGLEVTEATGGGALDYQKDNPACKPCRLPCDVKGYCSLDEEAAWKVADAKIGSTRP